MQFFNAIAIAALALFLPNNSTAAPPLITHPSAAKPKFEKFHSLDYGSKQHRQIWFQGHPIVVESRPVQYSICPSAIFLQKRFLFNHTLIKTQKINSRRKRSWTFACLFYGTISLLGFFTLTIVWQFANSINILPPSKTVIVRVQNFLRLGNTIILAQASFIKHTFFFFPGARQEHVPNCLCWAPPQLQSTYI